ncbi:MAG: ACP S-malonyltransferase [Dehalococcoidia bacterium]
MTKDPSRRHESNGTAQQANRRGLALLFPGQGSQHVGMGKRIADVSESARQVFAQADEALGIRISRLCFYGSEKELEDTVNTQPAILATSVAYLAYLRERLAEVGRRLRPSFMAGHSLGQFSAAVAAESLDFGDGLRLVLQRGRIMAEWARTRPGGLAAILGLSESDVRDVCEDAQGDVAVAVINTPDQTVICGEDDALQRAMKLARERGARPLRLRIGVPGHTPMMRDAGRELSHFISTLRFHEPKTPLVSNISSKLLTTADEVRQELSDQICAAVQWARCVVAMNEQGADTFVEVGPGHTLSSIVRRIRGEAQIFTAEDATAEQLRSLAGTVPLAHARSDANPSDDKPHDIEVGIAS